MKNLRQKGILDMLESQSAVTTAELAAHFNVSVETIRRDFDNLEKRGLIKKIYGGAIPGVSSGNVRIDTWQNRSLSESIEKKSIARVAANYIPNNCFIALDAGTTIYALCKELQMLGITSLTAIVTDLHTADEVLKMPFSKVYMVGGFLTHDGSVSGQFAEEYLKSFLNNIVDIDVFVFSTDGISIDEGFTSEEKGLNALKQMLMNKAKKKIAVVDHRKFNQKSLYRTCTLQDIDYLITDSGTSPEIIEHMRGNGVNVVVANIEE